MKYDFPICTHKEKRGHAPACSDCMKKSQKEYWDSEVLTRKKKAIVLANAFETMYLDQGKTILEIFTELLEKGQIT